MSLSKPDFYRKARSHFRFEVDTDFSDFNMNVVDEKRSTFGDDFVASASSNDGQEWWVVGGSTPITHVPQSEFPDPDEAYLFHAGIISQIHSNPSNEEQDDGCYHAFVSYAREDEEFVEKLVGELTARGLRVWWDKKELLVGDNIRASIEKGLTRSAYGITVISPDSINKTWPTDERGGLYARQTNTGSTVVLPVWRGLNSEDVQNEMPMEANTQAIIAEDDDAESAADELFRNIQTRARKGAKNAIGGNSETSSNDAMLDDLLASHRIIYTDTQILNVRDGDTQQIQTAISKIEDEFIEYHAKNDEVLNRLTDGSRYIIQGEIKPTPLSEANRFLDQYNGWSEIEQDPEDEMVADQLRSAAGFYEIEVPDSNGKFVMKFSDDYILKELKKYREYNIFAEVDHVYQEGEQESYMSILDDVTDIPDRNERAQMDVSLRQIANGLSELPQIEEVSKSDFFVSHPDIRITPIVIYR